MGDAESRATMAAARSVLFVDGPRDWPPGSVQDLLYWYPEADLAKLLQVSCDRLGLGSVWALGAHACMRLIDAAMHVPDPCRWASLSMLT